ncbi:MAG: hypothetical protein HFJ38_08635 [Bacilli bacterium]|nr:hypothetical protein [Bacilli bacterium]
MKEFLKMSETAQKVAEELDSQLGDCKDLAKEGMLVGDMRCCVVRTAVHILDNYPVKLTSAVNTEILDWFQNEYGICL